MIRIVDEVVGLGDDSFATAVRLRDTTMEMTVCVNCSHVLDEQAHYCPSCGTKVGLKAEGADPMLDKTLNGKYRVLAKIGVGSMGTVYLGEHIGLKKKVALKVLHPELQVTDEALQRFQREGIAAGQFNHQNAIQIFDFDREGRICYLAMEYVDGRTLREVIQAGCALDARAAIGFTLQLLRVLAEAHRHGIVHRDLKPDNMMVMESATGERVLKVLDFGLSKLLGRPLGASMQTQVGRLVGTPLYMAPEQGEGIQVDHRSDLYSVGVILYEMLAGEPPFRAGSLAEILLKHKTEPVPSVSASHPGGRIPADLEAIVDHALAKRREDRFQSAAEMMHALEDVRFDRLASDRSRRSHTAPLPDPFAASATTRSGRWLMIGAALALIVIVGLVLVFFTARPGSRVVTRVALKPPAERTEVERSYVALLDEARLALRRNDSDAVLVAAGEAQRLECADAEAFLLRGLAYRQRRDTDAALRELNEAVKREPSFATATATMGWVLLDRGDVDRAMERFAEALARDPKCAEALAGQGAVKCRRGQPADAVPLLRQAIESDRMLAAAHAYLGRALLALGQLNEAVESLVQAKRFDAKSPDAFALLGEAYLRLGRRDDAEKQWREALGLDADAVDVRVNLTSLLLDRGRLIDATQLAEIGLQRQQNAGQLHLLLGSAYYAQNRFDEALAEVERAQALGIQDPDARLLLGLLYHRQERYAEAIDQYEAALRQDRRLPKAHLNLGLALIALERFDEAATALERAIDLDPNDSFAHYSLGILCMDYLGDATRATEHLKRYQDLGGGDERVDGWLRKLGSS